MHLTLRHKINGAIVITFLLIAAIFSAIQLPFQQHRLQTTIHSIELLLKTLVERDLEQLANEIFDSRLTALEIRLRQMRKVDGILGIAVFDRSGKMLISDGATFMNRDLTLEELKTIRRHSQTRRVRERKQVGLVFSQAINFLGDNLGFIRVAYSLENVEWDQKLSFLIFGGLLGTILLVMLVVLNLILSGAILNPILYLRDATRLIARGNLEEEIDMPRKDELGALANSFEEMRDAIKEKISDLQRLTIIMESTSDLVSISRPDAQIIYINRAGRKMVGWGEYASLEEKVISDVHPAWASNKVKYIGIPAAIANNIWEGETALIGSDGQAFPVSQVIMSHKNSAGAVEYLSTIIRDISIQKQAEEELRHLRNYLSNVFDSMPSMLVGVDVDGRITQWNARAAQITGITPGEAVGNPLAQVFPQFADEMVRVREAIHKRKLQIDSKRTRQGPGRTCYEDVTIYPLTANGVEGAVIRIDDVTDRVRMEEMMIQSEKMLSVGGLAAGMAHEINNPLAGMMQTADVMATRLTNVNLSANRRSAEEVGLSMESIKAYMEKRGILRMITAINESGRRVAAIVDNMLSFARKSNAQVSSSSLADILDKTLELAASDYDLKNQYDFKMIEIQKEYADNLPPVPCEGAKIQQVLLNILRNGAQAMQAAGIEKPRFIVRTQFEKERDRVCMEIEDNGPGMEEATRKRVFEPFFTTKPVDVGTGLGLSVSYFIITENHGGGLIAESEPGQGAKFIIHLPLRREKT